MRDFRPSSPLSAIPTPKRPENAAEALHSRCKAPFPALSRPGFPASGRMILSRGGRRVPLPAGLDLHIP
jgi:hypothetical protein